MGAPSRPVVPVPYSYSQVRKKNYEMIVVLALLNYDLMARVKFS